ncbi:LuxR family transcriptional regulator [Yinghuangia seranimata]|uniref:LuxR family transcriptional regulator n=1 Tax=Yinghuangia seranimata TaxID=408067 RepID=UPI00248BC88F|nr:LuxR family transcriptional regulator [Yinghuangia seranimata]MDI2130371.1 LuxR C-terminal-related transcriptional regulator [Yinghuangia seranimata]
MRGDDRHEPLVPAKLRPPAAPGPVVARPRVDALLDRAAERASAVLVLGPGGIGKTVALARWAEARGGVAWLTADRRDNDPVRFWAHAVAALSGTAERPWTASDGLPVASDAWVADLGEYLADRGQGGPAAVLVVDELERVVEPRIHEQLELLVRTAGPGLTLVVGTRSAPAPDSLGRLLLSGRTAEIGWRDLRFTDDEAAVLLAADTGAPSAPEEAAALNAAADGWAAALASAALRQTLGADPVGPTGPTAAPWHDDHVLSERLLDHVWQELDREIREFLLDTAVLDTVHADVADAIRGRTDSLGHLDRLRRDGLFLTPDGPTAGRYRYQRLFRRALLDRLDAQGGDRARRLHAAAAHWHSAHGTAEDAIEHALTAGENGLAVRLLDTVYDDHLASGRLTTLERWLSALPDDGVREAPRLAERALQLWCALGRFDERDRWSRLHRTAPDGRVRTLGEAWRLCLPRERGDLVAAVRGARAFAARTEALPATATAPSRIALARTLLVAGEPDTALAQAGAVLRHADDLPPELAVLAHGIAGLAARLAGDDGKAEHHAAAAGRRLAASVHPPNARAMPEYVLLAALLENERDGDAHARAAAFLDVSPGVGDDHSMAAFAALLLAGAHAARGEHQDARARLAEADTRLARCPSPLGLTDLRNEVAAGLTGGTAAEPSPADAGLSAREVTILRYLRSGLTLPEIAADLYISVNTVKTHARHVYRKLGVANRTELAAVDAPGG